MTIAPPLRVLAADCSRCVGLCCVAPAFAASVDFAVDKPAGDPCPNLEADNRCGIHARLRESGFPGCVVFDCFGAGQRVTQELLPGTDWRTGEAFELTAEPQRAMDVFHHPYAYASRGGAEVAALEDAVYA